jgi:hypothetical protein
MITARIEFKPGQGQDFCPGAIQDVIEMKFESAEALVEAVREFEPAIYNCIARAGDKSFDLRAISGLSSDSDWDFVRAQ